MTEFAEDALMVGSEDRIYGTNLRARDRQRNSFHF